MRDRNDKTKSHRRKELMVTGVPQELRAALVSAAIDNKTSVNEQAVRILAAHYNVKAATPVNGLRGHDGPPPTRERNPDTEKLSIRGPAKLHRAIDRDARKRGGTLRGVVLEILCLNYRLPTEPIGRRPRTKETA